MTQIQINWNHWKPIFDEAKEKGFESVFKGRVYVAGPLTTGTNENITEIKKNIKRAVETGNKIINLGYTVFVPHLLYPLNERIERSYEYWMMTCLDWLKICDFLFRIPGESLGADLEVEFALRLGMPVLHDLKNFEETKNWLFRNKKGKE